METSQMFLSRAAMDALTSAAQTIGGLDGVAIIDILDRCTVVESGTIKNSVLVDRGALCMALNVLRRADKTEIADALESACSTPPAAESEEAITWPTRLANHPAGDDSGDRIIGFRVSEGDPILGKYGLSEPLAWFRRVTIDRFKSDAAPALRGVTDEELYEIARKAWDQGFAGSSGSVLDSVVDAVAAAVRAECEQDAKRYREVLEQIANQGPHYGPDGTYKTWKHWADIARDGLTQQEPTK